jgi:hypothetical protein
MAELDTAVRDYLGWSAVLEQSSELDLTENQRNQAADKRRQADETVAGRLLGAYHWALVPTTPEPGQPFTVVATKAEGQATHLAERVARKLGNDGALNTQQAGANIRLALNRVPKLWESGHVSVGDLWQVYATHPYMPRLRDQAVLTSGLVDQPLLWQQDGFALAQSHDEAAGRYVGLVLPREESTIPINDSVLLVKPEIAEAQRRAEKDTTEEDPPVDNPDDGDEVPHPKDDHTQAPKAPAKTRFFGVKTLSADKYGSEFKKLADEVLVHLIGDPQTRVRLRVEIEAENDDGFDETRVRTISENATQLKFDDAEFEDQ